MLSSRALSAVAAGTARVYMLQRAGMATAAAAARTLNGTTASVRNVCETSGLV